MKPNRKIRVYDKVFKMYAVNLYATGERTLTQISQELGIPGGTLAGWVQSYQADKACPCCKTVWKQNSLGIKCLGS